MTTYTDDDCVLTGTSLQPRRESHVLSQEELRVWWPFTRLAPERFPRAAKHHERHEELEAALL